MESYKASLVYAIFETLQINPGDVKWGIVVCGGAVEWARKVLLMTAVKLVDTVTAFKSVERSCRPVQWTVVLVLHDKKDLNENNKKLYLHDM